MAQQARADGNECLIYSEMKSTPCDILCLEHKMNETERKKRRKKEIMLKSKKHTAAPKKPKRGSDSLQRRLDKEKQ
jgi:hypothetical protein